MQNKTAVTDAIQAPYDDFATIYLNKKNDKKKDGLIISERPECDQSPKRNAWRDETRSHLRLSEMSLERARRMPMQLWLRIHTVQGMIYVRITQAICIWIQHDKKPCISLILSGKKTTGEQVSNLDAKPNLNQVPFPKELSRHAQSLYGHRLRLCSSCRNGNFLGWNGKICSVCLVQQEKKKKSSQILHQCPYKKWHKIKKRLQLDLCSNVLQLHQKNNKKFTWSKHTLGREGTRTLKRKERSLTLSWSRSSCSR